MRFIGLILVQVLILNHINLGGFVTPYLYILFVLMLPTGIGRMTMLVLGFLSGLCVDLFANMPGLHCATATLIAFIRILFADRILKRDSNQEIDTPSIQSVGFRPFAFYSFLLIFIYHFVYSLIELFSFHGLLRAILYAICSTLVTWTLSILTLTLFARKGHGTAKSVIALLAMCSLQTLPSSAQTAIGAWRDAFAYHSCNAVAITPQRVYAAAGNALFYYDKELDATLRLSKVEGLSDVDIATIAWHQQSQQLIVAYSNSNIDLLSAVGGKVTNISDIKRSNISGDKKIYALRCAGNKVYVACGFGIVCIDMAQREIDETYYIGPQGSPIAVYDIAVGDSLIIAATANGLYRADANTRFLNIADNWHPDTTSLLGYTAVNQLAYLSGNFYALVQSSNDTTLYTSASGTEWLPRLSGNIRHLTASQGHILLIYNDSIAICTPSLGTQNTIAGMDWLSMDANHAAMSQDGTLWAAHRWAGLASYAPPLGSSFQTYCPQGPAAQNIYRLTAWNHRILATPGGKSPTYANIYYPAQLSTCQESRWYSLEKNAALDTLYDLLNAAINPKDTTEILATTWGQGIVQIRNNQVANVYNKYNTDGAVQTYTQGNYHTTRTGAVAFDIKGNAWFTNSLVANAVVVRHADGTWQSYPTGSVVGSAEVDKLICDSINNYIWFAGSANRIYVLSPTDGKLAYVDPNHGSKLETASIGCLAQDHSGHIWLGTNKGIKVIYDTYHAFQNGGNGEVAPVNCSNILFQGENTEYLMAYENITAIAVDGANRKWVGTSTGGIYLLSATGLEQLQHFTATNSPLPSNNILSIAVQPRNGEVFIATDRGTVAYRSTATYASSLASNDIYAFPNPVRPNYNGLVAIKGFSRNALIHITDAAGHVLWTGTAHGGQAVWDLRTNSGEHVQSGIYFVFGTDENGNNRATTKIMVIN